MAAEWFYFGCHRQAGHYLFRQGMHQFWTRSPDRDLSRFDGMLPPQSDTTGYVATVSRLEGWGLSALAFWDYSVDKRGGCNSVVFAPSLTITPVDLLAEAQARFPEVFNRLPQPVTFAPGVPDILSEQEKELGACSISRAAIGDRTHDRRTEEGDRSAGEEKQHSGKAGRCDATRAGGTELGARGNNAAQHEVSDGGGTGNGAAPGVAVPAPGSAAAPFGMEPDDHEYDELGLPPDPAGVIASDGSQPE